MRWWSETDLKTQFKHQNLTLVSYASPGGDAGSWTLGLQAGRGEGVRAAADYLPGKFDF